MSEDLLIKQKREQKEIEQRIAECTSHIDSSRVSYQSLIDDIHQSEIVSKTAEDIIASARKAITKAQAVIQDHELFAKCVLNLLS